jgi:hypothetical protein
LGHFLWHLDLYDGARFYFYRLHRVANALFVICKAIATMIIIKRVAEGRAWTRAEVEKTFSLGKLSLEIPANMLELSRVEELEARQSSGADSDTLRHELSRTV